MAQVCGICDSRPFGRGGAPEAQATEERRQKLDAQRCYPLNGGADPDVERGQHDPGLDAILARMSEHDPKELTQSIHRIGHFTDAGNHRTRGQLLPALHRCGNELVSVREVPVEAPLGGAESRGQGLDRYCGNASVFDRVDSGSDPIVFAESGGRRHRLFHFPFRHNIRYRTVATIRHRMVDGGDPMIRNVHERRLRARAADVAPLLRELASDNDRVWPRDRWPAMKLSNGVTPGSTGGHGFVRYTVEGVDGHSVIFRFDETIGLRGTHSFELENTADGGCVLRHVLEGESLGAMKLGWPLVVRPLHDALVEDGLDNAAREVDGERLEKRPLSLYVRILRHGLNLVRQPPKVTPRGQRAVGDLVASAVAGIGVMHVLWGAGVTAWPGTDTRSLAERVVGGSTFPSPGACYVVAGLLGTASALMTMRSRVVDPKTFALSHLGTKTVGSVLLVRGLGGMVVSALGVIDETAAFRRANLALYSPLCIALGAGAFWSSRRTGERA